MHLLNWTRADEAQQFGHSVLIAQNHLTGKERLRTDTDDDIQLLVSHPLDFRQAHA